MFGVFVSSVSKMICVGKTSQIRLQESHLALVTDILLQIVIIFSLLAIVEPISHILIQPLSPVNRYLVIVAGKTDTNDHLDDTWVLDLH
jgi:hypothetical protein